MLLRMAIGLRPWRVSPFRFRPCLGGSDLMAGGSVDGSLKRGKIYKRFKMKQNLENPPKSPERPKRYTRFKMTARKKTIQKPQQQQEGPKTRSQTTNKRKEKEQLDEEEKETKVKSKMITKKQKTQEQEGKKEEEEDIKEVTEEEVKPKRLQYRSNLYSIVSLLHDVKFSQVQSEQIQKSPFANMLFAITEGSIDEQMVKKSDLILVKLIETYKRGQAKFLLAGKDIALTDLELGVIFGITSGPVKIHIKTHGRRPDTEFANRVFAGASTMHLPTMREIIEHILKPPVKKKQKKDQKEVSETEAAKDLARLLTLYTIGTLFFPTTGPNLNWSYLKLIEDLENSANYNWSEFITNYLVNELNSKNPTIVGGCTTALLVKQPELELTEQERGLFATLVLHEQEGKHKEQEPETQEENPQEENQDVKNLILELQQRIEVLEKENNVMKVEIKDRDKKIQEKELLIVELHQNVESLQNELSGYRKQSANYTDTEKETCSLHFEVEMLKEDIIENQVEIGGLYVEKDIAEEKIEEVTEELHDMAARCVSQHYKDQKIIEELEKQKQSKNVHNHESPIDDEDATEEEIDQTIKFTISSINAETQQTTKKRLRKSHTVDPSSLTKRVNKREDRKEKNMDDFQVYGKKKNKEKPTEKEKPAEKTAPELQYMGVETTKLAHVVSKMTRSS
ncbi:hypothetical protein RHMOL_Rhmol02G0277300 [Rhododendron molle]|uniref:Uncharacterized protein n=1 Tax=Rhododendron molle TaxID=49168 RepID=A0ACC0PW81_RHOML|nr:hypothetical protein RHMOL_Rhmol02G0277300 [Rhododendron molle]